MADDTMTAQLQAWAAGDRQAFDRVLPKLIDVLKALARRHLVDAPESTLHPTAMVNEAYLRLVGSPLSGFSGRGQFFALASKVLRGVLVDHLRARSSVKRGGDALRMPIEMAAALSEPATLDMENVLSLHDALRRLQAVDPRRGRLVELRYFGGLTVPEIAEMLDISVPTAERDWRVARRWLARDLGAAGRSVGATSEVGAAGDA